MDGNELLRDTIYLLCLILSLLLTHVVHPAPTPPCEWQDEKTNPPPPPPPPPPKKGILLFLDYKERRMKSKRYSAPRLAACVCACDVVKLQKHGGCVPGMELENVPVPLSLASEEEPPALTPAPAPLCACLPSARRIASVSLPGHEGIRFVLEAKEGGGGGGGQG